MSVISISRREELKRLAESAKDKKALYGEDIDLSVFEEPEEKESVDEISKLPPEIQNIAVSSGIDITEKDRAGSFVQLDHSVIYQKIQSAYKGQLEIMSTTDALEKYPELEEYWWKAVRVDQDKYTAYAELHPVHGYFIRVFPGQKVDRAIQACLLLQENAKMQNVHNIVIIEEGASAQLITGCSIAPKVKEGIHIGISEFYVKRGAKLVFTMIHNWAEGFHVRPRTGIIVEDNGVYINNYVLLKPVKSIQSFPTAILEGENSKAVFNSLIYGLKDSVIDIGSRIILRGKNSAGEAISRAIVADRSKIYARGTLIAQNDDSRAHLDCRGILFSDEGMMYAIPELVADKSPKSILSHEAAIGPIAEEEIEYLMTRGLSKEEAVSLITQGFMDVKILGLPKHLEDYIRRMIELTQKESM
ncbi:SufD family Fe-S cluster assembly protein [bacterium]|nr:SufD family Fe-S cluster assembly protein [bacterium]